MKNKKKQQECPSRLVFDIEANNLLLDVTKFWCAVTYNLDTKEYLFYRPDELKNFIKNLEEASLLIGHNIIGYDLPALKKLGGLNYTGEVIDTLILARLAYYDKPKSWSNSLDAYGLRLGEAKGKYSDWSKFTEEMLNYCKQDVIVTTKLLAHLKRKTNKWLPDSALVLEQDVQEIMIQQYTQGWEFDRKAAERLHVELVGEFDVALEKLQAVFKPMYIAKGTTKTPKKPFRRLGVYTVGEHQPIELTEFNPGSGNHIVWWVDKLYGKQKWEKTDKGNPKTDGDTLTKMFKDKEWSEPLLHYMEVNKLLGQLAEGPKAWLKQMRGTKIHHSVNILGTNTGRATHSDPNLAQVPSPKAYKGKESRQLFIPSKGMVSVGCDLSGVELRCLAHYLDMFDGGAYGREILEGDIHTVNQKAAGLPTRDNAKRFIYGFLYGAGNAKIGEIVKGTAQDGARLKASFLSKLPALKKLGDMVKKAAKRGYLRGWSGRRLHIRSPHSALNVLLQSLGGYISKVWMIEAHKIIKEEGLICNQVGWVHDELQFEVVPEHEERLRQVLEETSVTAGEVMDLKIRINSEAKVGQSWYDVH